MRSVEINAIHLFQTTNLVESFFLTTGDTTGGGGFIFPVAAGDG